MNESPNKEVQITASDVAFAFGYPTSSFKNELGLIGWGVIMSEADRLACGERFGSRRNALESGREMGPSFAWSHVAAATESYIPTKIVVKAPIKEALDNKMQITASDLAAAFGYSTTSFMKKLGLIGWGVIMSEADRLAHVDQFKSSHKSRGPWTEPPLAWKHLAAATESYIPTKTPNEPKLENRNEGYLYVLYDKRTEMCKIGCTRSGSGRRQREIMAAHGSELVNVLNAKVANRYAAETQCHQQFQDCRRNGEWFQADIVRVAKYVDEQVECQTIDFADFPTLPQYCIFSELKNPDNE